MGALARVEGEFAIADLLREAAAHALDIPSRHDPTPRIDNPIMAGTILATEVQPGLLVSAQDLQYLGDGALQGETERSLGCGLLLAGDIDQLEVDGHSSVKHDHGCVTLIGFGETARWRRAYHAQQRHRAFGITLQPRFFDRFGQTVTERALPRLSSLLEAGVRSCQLPHSPLLVRLAVQAMEHSYSGELSALLQESVALRFIVEMETMLGEEARLAAEIGYKRYEQVRRAKERLDQSLNDPPSTLDLARDLGTNVASLQVAFKQAHGTTLFGYVRDRRLAMARILIHEHGLAIAEAGFRVGFSSASAFTAAYRRHFGYPPSAAAR